MRPLSLLLWFSFLSGSMINAQNPLVAESQQKLALREAIFRYMFQHYDYGSDLKVYCIAAEKALPDQFVRRFDQVKPRVVWAFECDNSGSMNGITHKKSREPRLLMKIQELHWQGGTRAEAHVMIFSDGIAANWNTLQLALDGGHWVVRSDKLTGVS